MSNNNTEDALRRDLEKLGAHEYEVVALTMDPRRGLAALNYAQQRGASHPVAYAIKVFDNPSWEPLAEKARFETNRTVDVECEVCHGDRFVVAHMRKPMTSEWQHERGMAPSATELFEEMRGCPACNT